jgi:PKD repeat protein
MTAAGRPTAEFSFSPHEPRVSQTLQLFDSSVDVLGPGIAWRAWDFGDGVTATGSSPTHRYAHAGEYTIMLTAATFDGRVATSERTVVVTQNGARRSFD